METYLDSKKVFSLALKGLASEFLEKIEKDDLGDVLGNAFHQYAVGIITLDQLSKIIRDFTEIEVTNFDLIRIARDINKLKCRLESIDNQRFSTPT